MIYKITERDYYYIPTLEGAGADFDPVIWTREVESTVTSLSEVLDAAKAFNDVWKEVRMTTFSDGFELNSGAGSERPNHPDHYFTPRHELCVEWNQKGLQWD